MSKRINIVIEGIDGSGKSSQVERLRELYGFSTEAFPKHDGLGKEIRELLKKGKTDNRTLAILNTAEKLLYAENDTKKDGVVVFDRWLMSQLAYNDFILPSLNTPDDSLLIESVIDAVDIDLYIYIDIPVEVAIERINGRNEEKYAVETMNGLINIAAHYEGAKHIIETYSTSEVEVIDGVGTFEEVAERIDEVLRKNKIIQ